MPQILTNEIAICNFLTTASEVWDQFHCCDKDFCVDSETGMVFCWKPSIYTCTLKLKPTISSYT